MNDLCRCFGESRKQFIARMCRIVARKRRRGAGWHDGVTLKLCCAARLCVDYHHARIAERRERREIAELTRKTHELLIRHGDYSLLFVPY